jgi:hypothetical protein
VLLTFGLWQPGRPWPTIRNVYAIRYATLADFPVASLVAGADPARRADLAMMLWFLESDNGAVLSIRG